VLNLLQNIENPDKSKKLIAMFGNHSVNNFTSVLKDIHQVHQDTTNEITLLEDQNEQLQDKYRTLLTKYIDLKKIPHESTEEANSHCYGIRYHHYGPLLLTLL